MVLAALKRARTLFPFLILGIDTDNGGEFIIEVLIAYCEKEQITLKQGRPHLKNDQCFVEQRNGAIVRQVVGYDRLVGEHAYRQLTELYRALRLYVNCFQPSMKLQSKQRDRKKVRYVYDSAKTPLQRLLLSEVLPTKQQQAVFRCAVSCSPLVSSIPAAAIRIFSVESCTAGNVPAERSIPDPVAGLHTLYSRTREEKTRPGLAAHPQRPL